MKTTIDIHDELLALAKRHAAETGRPLRALVEEGLRRVLSASTVRDRYTLPDVRAGDPRAPDPLEQFSWPELRERTYRDSGTL